MIYRFVLLLTAAATLTACELTDAISSVRQMPGKMDNMKSGIDNTSESIRLQKVGLGVENIEKEENGVVLLPYAINQSQWAKLIAENATLEELLKLQQKWTNMVNEAIYPEYADEQNPTDIQKLARAQRLNHHKNATISGMFLVATLLPETMVTQLFNHVHEGKELSIYAYSLLAMRVEGLRDIAITSGYLNRPTQDVGDLEKAVYDAQCMDRILSVSNKFLARMKYGFTGFVPEVAGEPAKSKEMEWDREKARVTSLDVWGKLRDAALDQVKAEASAISEDGATDQRIVARDQARLVKAKAAIDATLAKWEKVASAQP